MPLGLILCLYHFDAFLLLVCSVDSDYEGGTGREGIADETIYFGDRGCRHCSQVLLISNSFSEINLNILKIATLAKNIISCFISQKENGRVLNNANGEPLICIR